MPRSTIVKLLDDFDGKELPEDTKPVNVSLGRTTYALYLSETNHGKLLEALNPFIDGAEKVSTTTATTPAAGSTTTAAAKKAKKEHDAKVRDWARATKFEFKGAAGETKTLGERGQIPDAVYTAYDEAHPAEPEEAVSE